jgi:uncharacterized protein (TIGR02594 family)
MKRLLGAFLLATALQSTLTYEVQARPRHRVHIQPQAQESGLFGFFHRLGFGQSEVKIVHRPRHGGHRARHRAEKLKETPSATESVSEHVSGFGSSVVSAARSYIGAGAIFGRANLWCATFVNYILAKTGHEGTHSDLAFSFAHYGHEVSGPEVGAIAVMGRRGGGHVGIVTGTDGHGNPIIVSGNHGNRVREAVYPRHRIITFRKP